MRNRQDHCSVEGCPRPHKSLGYCNAHYQQIKRYGKIVFEQARASMRQHEICVVEGCGREHKSRGYCQTHYMQWKRGGPITPIIEFRNRNGPEICTESECGLPVKAKGLCHAHYANTLRHGYTKYPDRKKPAKPCTIPGCLNWLYSNGLCHQHHMQTRKLAGYGMTMDGFLQILKEQEYVCGICGQKESSAHQSGKVKSLSVDHHHGTGKVRALLCNRCNRTLGMVEDDSMLLRQMADYLDRHKE